MNETERELEPASPDEDVADRDPYASLRLRDFRWFLGASIVATVGTEMQAVTVGWELYERHRLRTGPWSGRLGANPTRVVARVAGGSSRRSVFEKKRHLGGASVSNRGGVGFGGGVVRQGADLAGLRPLGFDRHGVGIQPAARGSIMPQLVPRELFANAVAWRSSGWQTAAAVGPALGGVGIAIFKAAGPIYLINAFCVFVAFLGIRLVRCGPQVKSTEPFSARSLGGRGLFGTRI